ncbi:MAG: hypothetical protein R3E66_05820 [bacterium]
MHPRFPGNNVHVGLHVLGCVTRLKREHDVARTAVRANAGDGQDIAFGGPALAEQALDAKYAARSSEALSRAARLRPTGT